MILNAVLVLILTIVLCFVANKKIRNVIVVLWFLFLCSILLQASPSNLEGTVMMLGLFLPFLIYFLDQGTGRNRQGSVSYTPTGVNQVVSILICALLGSILVLQVYKNRILIDSLWVPEQLQNRTVYQFMSEYYDVGVLIASIVVISSALLSQRVARSKQA